MNIKKLSKTVKPYITIGGCVLLFLLIFGGTIFATISAFTRMTKDVGSVPGRVLDSGVVRRECEKYKNDLNAKFESAKNIYTQSVVLKVQELSNNAALSIEERNSINQTALSIIFAPTTQEQQTAANTLVGTIAKFNQKYDVSDPSLRRGVAEAISSGRTKFEASMKEVIDVKTQFKNYMQDNKVYLPGGSEAISVLEFNGCIEDPTAFFAQYDTPTSTQTKNTFGGGFDAPVLQTTTPIKK